jgi:hypothetical protein
MDCNTNSGIHTRVSEILTYESTCAEVMNERNQFTAQAAI